MSFQLTLDQFLGEVAQFWTLIGSADFWDLDPKHRDGAIRGLTHAYMAVGNDEIDSAATAYQAAALEFASRNTVMRSRAV